MILAFIPRVDFDVDMLQCWRLLFVLSNMAAFDVRIFTMGAFDSGFFTLVDFDV